MFRRNLIALAAIGLFVPAMAHAAGDKDAGKATYDLNCVTCHGASGKGDGPVAVALPADSKPRDFSKGEFKYDTDGDGKTGTDADLTNIIQKGATPYGGNPLMAALPHLSDEDVANIIAYVRTLKK